MPSPPIKNHIHRNNNTGPVRMFWSSLGNIITIIPGLPITINVPDLVNNAIAGGSGILGNIGSAIQGIPMFNRVVPQESPRPLQYMIVVPTQVNSESNRPLFEEDFYP